MMHATVHDTLTFERSFETPLATLWEAFADPEARALWGVPSPTAVIHYDEADFQIGGRDVSRCGSQDDPRYRVEAIYLDIQPSKRIVYSERVNDGDVPLSSALHTVEMSDEAGRAFLKITVQIASYDDADMVQGVRHGMTAALENLSRSMAGKKAALN